MDAHDRRTNLGEKILPIVLPFMFRAENFTDNPRIMHSSDSMKKIYITTDSGKLRKTVHKMNSRNMTNCDDTPVQHLNCHAKQSAMEGPDL
jgi:hypothetical protein